MKYRLEKDSLGEMKVPQNAYYGAQTQRAVENFQISNLRFSNQFIQSLALIKKSSAKVNTELGLLDKDIAEVIISVAEEIINGNYLSEFVIDIFQTGSGTSTNMNMNEVISNIAIEKSGGKKGDKKSVVLIEYPRKGTWAVGFATKENKGEIKNKVGEELVNVFVPTTPNPTSGFLLMFLKKEVIYLDMSFEQASKFIVSAGSTDIEN